VDKKVVAIVRYEKPLESLRRVIDLCGGFDHLPANARVFIKPNVVFWTAKTVFPAWGVVTTSRVVEDTVRLLKERGISDITIGEGTVTSKPKDRETPAHAYETLGYNVLKQRYGVKVLNILERPFEEVDLGGGVVLNMNSDALNSDFLVNLPVLKTHAQAVVSLGIKNLKGLIDIKSRKKCHGADQVKNLHYMIARLADKMPPSLTLVDGIFTNERGPGFDGKIHRSNILIGSSDMFSADKTGARVLGFDPKDIPHLVHAAQNNGRPIDLSDVDIAGEKIEDVAAHHEYGFPYDEEVDLPAPMAKMGIKGLHYPKYDLTMCTYCSGINGVILSAIAAAYKGEPFDEVEILTGKSMEPRPDRRKTILLGKCMYDKNKDNPNIQEMIAVKGCPPQPKAIVKALHQAGIMVNPAIFDNIDLAPGFFMKRYEGKPEFDMNLFRVL
jgi:uncharacterized protein (DUF362 family)